MDESGQNPAEKPAGPDWALVRPAGDRLPDRGPRYAETPADPTAPGAAVVAEPWNTATAAIFVVIAVAGLLRLRGRLGQFPFALGCLGVLFVGGVGGTLYHATRTRPIYFYLDVIPISVLGLAGAAFLAMRLWGRRGWAYLGLSFVGYVAFSGVFFAVLAPLPLFRDYPTLPVNVSYAALAVCLLMPLGFMLVRTKFRDGGLVLGALAAFGVAWFCRLVDRSGLGDMPQGTHWLWHVFGAVTTAMLVEYFIRREAEAVSGRREATAVPSA